MITVNSSLSTEQIQLQQNEAYSASCEYNHERVKSIQFNRFSINYVLRTKHTCECLLRLVKMTKWYKRFGL